MKKYILPLLALVALASCDKEDIPLTPETPQYSISISSDENVHNFYIAVNGVGQTETSFKANAGDSVYVLPFFEQGYCFDKWEVTNGTLVPEFGRFTFVVTEDFEATCLSIFPEFLPDVVADANYYFKTTDENIPALRSLLKADTLCRFKSTSDYDVRGAIYGVDPGIKYEIYRTDGTVVGADYDFETQLTNVSVSRGIAGNFKFNGTTYSYDINYPEANSPYYPFDLCGNCGAPLTTIATCNNYWKLGDNQDMGFMLKRHYYATSDLNSDGGYKSYYTRIFYGSYRYSSSNLYWWEDGMYGDEDAIPRPFYETTITGLRLVMNPNGTKWTPEQNIIDPETGIKWYLADIYFDGDEYYTADNRRLGADLNDGAAGDFIYLYVTNDTRTGRKIALHHPLTYKLRDKMFGGADSINQAFFGAGICSWTSHTWNVKADDFLNAVGESVCDEWKPYYTGVTRRVDFVRLYDKNMKPINPELPANFNLNARGKDEIFVSYSYVTVQDPQWWNEWY